MLISLLVSVLSYQYGPDLVMVYANEAFYALLQRVLANVIVNQNKYTKILVILLYEFAVCNIHKTLFSLIIDP